MKKIACIVCLWAMASFYSYGQVKIGDSPGTINPNSLLELESNTKGLLAPRVTLTNLASATPLTAPVPAGMLVYNSGGSIANGFYYWNGTSWLLVNSAGNSRINFVLVKSAADFPAPVGGIITLVAGTTYEINGTITLTSRINLNNAWLQGVDAVNDKLIYTPNSGELFTGANGGNIKWLTLSAPTAGATLFNLNAAGANRNLVMQNLYIAGCNNVGTIAGFGGSVFMQTVAYLANSNGITFTNDTNVIVLNALWDKGNFGTYERYTGNFGVVLKSGGAMEALSANSATAINISGITGIASGEFKNVVFYGNGTYKTGTFSNKWEVESNGIVTEKDDVGSGNIYLTATATTIIANVNTNYKVAGTSTSSNLFRVTAPTNNRLTYTGAKTRRFQIICSMAATFAGASGGKFFSFYIAKNGTILPESRLQVKLINNTDQTALTLSCTVSLSTNDYVEIWVANNTDATDITIQSMNLAIK